MLFVLKFLHYAVGIINLVLNRFKVCIRVVGVEEFVDPEDRIYILIPYIRYIMCVPDGHVDIRRFIPVQIKVHHLIRPYPPQLYSCLSFDHREPLDFAGMKMISPCDPRSGCRKGNLPSKFRFNRFYKGPPVIGIHLQLHRVDLLNINIAPEGVEQVALKGMVESGELAVVEVVGFETVDQGEELGYVFFDGVGDGDW